MELLEEQSVKRIINSEEILESYLPLLEQMFIEDYGKKYAQIIKTRLQNTICITTSTPDYDYEFIKQYHQEKNIPNLNAVINDYHNFQDLKKEIALKSNIAVYNLICKYFELDPRKHFQNLQEIITLPFMSYSSKTKTNLNSAIRTITIPNLEEQKEQYLTKCANIGIKPLTDSKKIDLLLDKIVLIFKNFHHELLTKSSFINNLKYSIFSITGTSYTQSDLSTLIEYPAACTIFYNRKKDIITNLVYLPLTQIAQEGYNIDSFLLHEFRHAVELSLKGIGINLQGYYSGYRMLNELRTELHAHEDLNRIETIFRRTNKYSGYTPYLPLMERFINNFQYVFDDIAINNNVDMLEKIFNKEELTKLENLISETFSMTKNYSLINSSVFAKVDVTDIDEQILKLRDISTTNGIKRYNKILKKENNY